MRPPQSPARAARTPLGWTLCAVCAASALAGCAGTETGNAADGTPLRFEFRLVAEGMAPAPVDADGATFRVDAAIGRVQRIDLSLPDGLSCADVAGQFAGGRCDTDHIRYEGPWTVDLLRGTSEPPMDGLRAPAGLYRRIDVRLDSDDTALALVVDGTVPAGLPAERFALVGDFGEDVRFEGEAAVVRGADPARLDLRLPVEAWLADQPLAACIDAGEVPVDDGVATITDSLDGACETTVDGVRRAMKRDARLD